ncbi:MAG: 5,6-dimethylbenzimidazole synthase [Proteobacteria bacterium]|nr:5,6-dimethylbenzimidazole synthase [Pseudomonadota bacterium]
MELIKAIEARRDTRHFTDEGVPQEILQKALLAAIHAPSVGLSQPIRFIDISSSSRQDLLDNFCQSRAHAEAEINEHDRLALHRSLKLESLAQAPIILAIFCVYPAEDDYTIGVIGNRRALEWSCACAVQNLWLALTAEGFGGGWVTILDMQSLAKKIGVPANWEAMGLFCIGRPATDYGGRPMLEQLGWKSYEQKTKLIYEIRHI